MPVTPVAQIPYPNLSDKPLIPTDMRNLASVTDSWVSSLDAAFTARMAAVSSRLDAVTTRIATTNTTLTAANASMSSGDTAITSEQASLTSVEIRLATQDTTANTLLSRFNSDNNSLRVLTWDRPRGIFSRLGSSSTLSVGSGDTGVHWMQTAFVPYDTTYATMRVFYNLQASMSAGQYLEFRICYTYGNNPPTWGNTIAQLDYQGNPESNWYCFAISGITPTNSSSGMTIGLGCAGGGTAYQTYVVGSTIQHLTGNV